MLKIIWRCHPLYGSVHYFSNCLTESMMNRLVNEHAHSLNDCYKQLLADIHSLEEPETLKATYVTNLEKSYQNIVSDVSKIEEAVHMEL